MGQLVSSSLRASVVRPSSLRRSGAAIEELSINGTPVNGPIVNLESPMLSVVANVIRIDNANFITLADATPITGIDPAINNAFFFTLVGNRSIDPPIAANLVDGEKLTFLIKMGATGPFTLTWASGVSGAYQFANVLSPQGVKLADFDALLLAMPDSTTMRIGFEYSVQDDRCSCVALAGYWP